MITDPIIQLFGKVFYEGLRQEGQLRWESLNAVTREKYCQDALKLIYSVAPPPTVVEDEVLPIQYEYKIINQFRNLSTTEIAESEQELNALARERWEVLQVIPMNNSNRVTIYLRREAQ